MQCKEGIFNDALGEKLRRNNLPTQLTTEIKIAALCCRARLSGFRQNTDPRPDN